MCPVLSWTLIVIRKTTHVVSAWSLHDPFKEKKVMTPLSWVMAPISTGSPPSFWVMTANFYGSWRLQVLLNTEPGFARKRNAAKGPSRYSWR